jgi:hypothetical protein
MQHHSPVMVRVLQQLSIAQLNTILAECGQGQLPAFCTLPVLTSCSGVDGAWCVSFDIERKSYSAAPNSVIAQVTVILSSLADGATLTAMQDF